MAEAPLPPWNADQLCQAEQPILKERRAKLFGSAPTDAELNDTLFGICLSGGGIRSATFNLGILQGLAAVHLLRYADYLSTVSGGGYVGAWLHGLIKRFPDTYEQCLRQERAAPGDASVDPISFLRKYSNYLAPQLGLLSPDTWVIAAIWFRNTLLNQVVLYLWLLSALLVPLIVANGTNLLTAHLRTHYGLRWWLGAAATAFLAVAVVTMARNLRRVVARELEQQPGDPATHSDGAPSTASTVWFTVLLPLWLSAAALSILCSARVLDLTYRPTLYAVGCSLLALFFLLLSIGGFWSCYARRHLPTKARKVGGVTLGLSIIAASSALSLGLLTGVWWLLENWLPAQQGGPLPLPVWHAALCIAVGPILILAALVLGMTLAVGLMGLDFPDGAREWTSSISARNFIMVFGWASAFGLTVFAPPLIVYWFQHATVSFAGATGTWLGSTLAAVWSGRSSRTTGQGSANEARRSKSFLMEAIASALPPVAILGLLLAFGTLSYVAMPVVLAHLPFLSHNSHGTPLTLTASETECLIGIMLGLLALAIGLSSRFNINEFSLSHFYKNRLVRCYLGASCAGTRRPNRVTGFDPLDDFPIADLLPANHYRGPFAVVNCALNLNHGEELAWQERKASSFIFTPLASGYCPSQKERSGYVPTVGFGGKNGPHLGTAIATSGAAVSPNWGYHTNPATAFLLTIFNVRLGWWVGNTQKPDMAARSGPRVALASLLAELLGRTREDSNFVNLSDGGHFENLGLYELLRRRCRFIIVGDGEQDPTYIFESLGGAIRKARIDFGIEITISPKRIALSEGVSKAHCALGTIHYPDRAEPGHLLYLKASLTGDEPYDVAQYGKVHSSFPQETTLNQFFTESQFESYRSLGEHIVAKAFGRIPPLQTYADLPRVFDRLRRTWMESAAAGAGPGVFSRHADAYSALLRELAADPDLRFLDPEIIDGANAATTPATPAQENKALLYCLRCIQLMENVYLDLGFEDDSQYNAQENEGWRQLFAKWKAGAYFSRAWSANGSAFGHGFQSFYARI